MAIATFCCTRSGPKPTCLTRFGFTHSHQKLETRVSISRRLNSSNSLSPADNNNKNKYELHDGASSQICRNGSPAFVKLPEDSTLTGGKLKRRKVVVHSFKALAAGGVEGVVAEIGWSGVEKDRPACFELIALASNCSLKVKSAFGVSSVWYWPWRP